MVELDAFLKERDCVLYVIRGNHDDPTFFEGDYMYDNLKLLPDYTILELEGRKVLFVGGAISIDRSDRRMWNAEAIGYNSERRSYWEGEKFNLDTEKLMGYRDIDVVVTHTTPSFIWPTELNHLVQHFIRVDDQLYGDLMEERDKLDKMYDALTFDGNNPTSRWYYGHFHNSQITEFRGTEFRLLGINESYELREGINI